MARHEITDLGNDAQFMVFVRLKTAWNNFSFAVHLPTYQEKLKKVDSFTTVNVPYMEYGTSAFAGSLHVCSSRWCFGHHKNQQGFMNSWKWQSKIFRHVLSS